jgi:ribonuclease T1
MAAVALLLVGCGGTKTAAETAAGTALAPSSASTSVRAVQVSDLPPEAVRTLQLIAAGGPDPYSKDGITFQNRERVLPRQRDGFYHEYTVETPGSSDRGARRIVTGEDGSRFYTDDHYASFREVIDR